MTLGCLSAKERIYRILEKLCLRAAWLLAGRAGRQGARSPQRRPGGRERGNHNASVPCRKASSGNWQGRADPRTQPERRQSAPSPGPENAARRQPERFRCLETAKNHYDFRALRLRRKTMFSKHTKLYAAAAPRRRRRAPRSGTCFVYVGAGWRFFEKGGFLVSSILAQHFLPLFPAHFGN